MVHDNLTGRLKTILLAAPAALLFSIGMVVAFSDVAMGQIGNSLPRETYYLAKRDYHAGNFRSAERGFLRSLNSGLRIGNRRWIDSICSYTMLGELYFQQGNLAGSLKSHEAALEILLANRDWMNRLRYPQIGPSNDRVQARIVWGTRPTVMGEFPDSMSSQEGTFDVQTSFQIGGAVNPAHMRSVNAVEVARCLAVSLRRRALLLGQTVSVSPMSARLSSAVARTNPPATHWANAWVEVLYGMAQLNEGLRKECVGHLATGVIAGGFDHPLTGIALLEIGRYHLQLGEYEAAVARLQEASLAAARFRQPDVVLEAFTLMKDAFLANDGKGIFPPIAKSLVYARHEDFYRLMLGVQIATAEVAVYANDLAVATASLTQARALMTRTDQLPTALGAHLNYVDAMLAYRAGNRVAGKVALQAAIANRQRASIKLFHLATVESLRLAGRRVLGAQDLETLYSRLLREPTSRDWETQPLDTFSWMLLDHTPSMTNWFELLVDQKEYDKAFEISEQLKRHRFYQSLPLGGRLLALRWLFDGDRKSMDKRFGKMQDSLRQRYPLFNQLSRQAIRVRAELQQIPLLPKDEQQRLQQKKLFSELSVTSEKQESAIREVALRRERAPLVFPEQRDLSTLQNSLGSDQAMLVFVTTSQGWHAWFIRDNMHEYWPIRKPQAVRRQIRELLRQIGNFKGNAALTDKELVGDKWKNTSKTLWKSLVGKFPSNGWDGLEELIIVPDGPLWYLPFEMLRVPADQISGEDEDDILLALARMRYAPLASLATGERRAHNANLATTFVGGQLFPGEDTTDAQEMLVQLRATFPDLNLIAKQKPSATSNYASSLMNRLIVWNDVNVSYNRPFGWSPAQYDRKSKASELGDWFEYPWGSPDQIILPGFHTKAEVALTKDADGQEIFLALCGLMSSGTRTVLMSRWRTGGRAPATLVREFSREIITATASQAWRTATEQSRSEMLNAESEPRFRPSSKTPEEISGDHPFFWAGYMLVDSGAMPLPANAGQAMAEANENLVVEPVVDDADVDGPQNDEPQNDEGAPLPASESDDVPPDEPVPSVP